MISQECQSNKLRQHFDTLQSLYTIQDPQLVLHGSTDFVTFLPGSPHYILSLPSSDAFDITALCIRTNVSTVWFILEYEDASIFRKQVSDMNGVPMQMILHYI